MFTLLQHYLYKSLKLFEYFRNSLDVINLVDDQYKNGIHFGLLLAKYWSKRFAQKLIFLVCALWCVWLQYGAGSYMQAVSAAFGFWDIVGIDR